MLINNLPIHMHINYDKNIRYLEYQSNNHVYVARNNDFIKENNYSVLDLTSTNNKILIGLHPRIYHNLIDNLAKILYLDKNFKSSPSWGDFEFILDSSDIPSYFYDKDGPAFFKFFLEVLEKKHINFTIINSSPKRMQELNKINNTSHPNKNVIIKADNCAIFKDTELKLQNLDLLSNLFSEYSKDEVANKVVYLSRNVKSQKYINMDRQNNEYLIEEFFKNNGCEIVIPETFKTFEDQIKYFSSVKTLIGLTGSGLLNMLMMPNKSNIVEIYTPLETSSYNVETKSRMKRTSTHGQYRDIAWSKNHTYVSIQNEYNSNSKDLVDKLEKNKIVGVLLNNESF